MSGRVLVTGGAGFIGSHLVEALCGRGERPVVLDDFNDFYDPARKERNVSAVAARIDLVREDLCSADLQRILSSRGVDRVVHLAARAGVRPSVTDPDLYHRVNVTGTQRLLEACRRSGVRRFVFGSSSSVYGARAAPPFREDDPCTAPASPYAATKRIGELYADLYARLWGLEAICLRFFNAHGPRQRPDMAIHAFARAMLDGRALVVYGDGSVRRDFTYVDDIVAGIVAALNVPAPVRGSAAVYNLGNEAPVTVTDLIRLIERATGRSARIERRPAAPGDIPLTCADVSRARRDLGFSARTSLDEGIRRFVDWLRAGG